MCLMLLYALSRPWIVLSSDCPYSLAVDNMVRRRGNKLRSIPQLDMNKH